MRPPKKLRRRANRFVRSLDAQRSKGVKRYRLLGYGPHDNGCGYPWFSAASPTFNSTMRRR